MALSEEEIKLVQETWAVLAQDKENNGKFVLKHYFTKHSDYLPKFPKFRNLTLDEVLVHPKLNAHAVNFMTVLGEAIAVLTDPEEIRTNLEKLGKFHAKYKIEKSHFEDLKTVLLNVLEDHFKLNKNEISAWRKTLDVAIAMISTAL